MGMRTNKTKEDFIEAAKHSFSISGMCRFLGWKPSGSYNVIKKYIREYDIDTSHFTGKKCVGRVAYNKLSAIEYSKSYYCKSAILLKKLIEEGLKEHKCEKCGRTEWEGDKIPLELHHIDGNHYNNVFDNLIALCPNCHAQTNGYKGRKKRFCSECGKEITRYSKTGLCNVCNHAINQRKVDWPTKEELELLLETNSMEAIGRLYSVSGATVKKWKNKYNIKMNKRKKNIK